MTKVVLLVEGDGDRTAVPELIRRVAGAMALSVTAQPHPIKCGDVPTIRRVGQLEKFVEYALRREGDAALLVLDCDDDCPVEIATEFAKRSCGLVERYKKKFAVCLLYREFETMFLFSLEALAQEYPGYGWELKEDDLTRNWETTRGAKGALNRKMGRYHYKETRDQVRFVTKLPLDSPKDRYRSLGHLFRVLTWFEEDTLPSVYPATAETGA